MPDFERLRSQFPAVVSRLASPNPETISEIRLSPLSSIGMFSWVALLSERKVSACKTCFLPMTLGVMTVRTTLPGMQLYTANFLTERRGKGGAAYSPRCALCLETQYYPNAMACAGFEKPILRKGETWRHSTILLFSV